MQINIRSILNTLRACLLDSRGVTSIIFSLILVPLLAFAGAALDYSRAYGTRSALQGAADSAALAAADKFETDESARKTIGEDIFSANLANNAAVVSATPQISFGEDTAIVTASATISTVLLGLVKIDTVDVGVTATAQHAPEIGPVCVLALDRASDEAIGLDGTAELVANDCVVHANSRSDVALTAPGSTDARADTFCAVGEYSGSNFSPEPIKHCSVVPDPFEHIEMPLSGGCNYNNKRYNHGSHSISPGIYCGGITINAFAEVSMAPGIYIIKNGPLTMHANSWLRGTDIAIYLVGEDAILDIKSNSNLEISARSFGPYAGLAVMQDRDSDYGETSLLEGGGTVNIVGAIYLPEQTLKTGGQGIIGQDSPYMPIVAKLLKFHGNATIKINYDPDADGFPDFLPNVRAGTPRLIN